MLGLLRPLAGPANRAIHLAPSCARQMSGSGAVVDQMLAYVWGDLQAQGQQSVDVLRSGLSMQPDPAAGFDTARLHLALAEVFAAEHNWADAVASSQAAAAAAAADGGRPAAQDLAALARLQAARALLAAGKDGDAMASSSGGGDGGSSMGPASAASLAQQALVAHATAARVEPALVQQLQGVLAAASPQAGEGGGGVGGVLLALGHKVSGDVLLAQGALDEAAGAFDAAGRALGPAASSTSGSGNTSSGLSWRLQQEVAADVAAGRAQVAMASRQWDASEELLGPALRAAEAAGGERGAMLAPVLLLLAGGYARSARVMFAEGMLREAAKLLGGGGGDPGRLAESAAGSSSPQAAHASLRAALAWRFAQLLTALPNRGAEAQAWAATARALWGHAGGGFAGAALEGVLGDDVALKGQGDHGHGRGAVVGVWARRLLPPLA